MWFHITILFFGISQVAFGGDLEEQIRKLKSRNTQEVFEAFNALSRSSRNQYADNTSQATFLALADAIRLGLITHQKEINRLGGSKAANMFSEAGDRVVQLQASSELGFRAATNFRLIDRRLAKLALIVTSRLNGRREDGSSMVPEADVYLKMVLSKKPMVLHPYLYSRSGLLRLETAAVLLNNEKAGAEEIREALEPVLDVLVNKDTSQRLRPTQDLGGFAMYVGQRGRFLADPILNILEGMTPNRSNQNMFFKLFFSASYLGVQHPQVVSRLQAVLVKVAPAFDAESQKTLGRFLQYCQTGVGLVIRDYLDFVTKTLKEGGPARKDLESMLTIELFGESPTLSRLTDALLILGAEDREGYLLDIIENLDREAALAVVHDLIKRGGINLELQLRQLTPCKQYVDEAD